MSSSSNSSCGVACKEEDSRSSHKGKEEDSHSVRRGKDYKREEEEKQTQLATELDNTFLAKPEVRSPLSTEGWGSRQLDLP